MKRVGTSAGTEAGFTLVELLTTMAIIAVLAGLAIPTFKTTRERSYKAVLQSDFRNLKTVALAAISRADETPSFLITAPITGPSDVPYPLNTMRLSSNVTLDYATYTLDPSSGTTLSFQLSHPRYECVLVFSLIGSVSTENEVCPPVAP